VFTKSGHFLASGLFFLLYVTLLLFVAFVLAGGRGFDISEPASRSTAECLHSKGFHFGVARGWHSNGGFDSGAIESLRSMKEVGIMGSVYLFPCAENDAPAQVREMIHSLGSSHYDTVWLDIETNPSAHCGWPADHARNCRYVKELVTEVEKHGKKPGVYASHFMWESIMGAGCKSVSHTKLWYAHYDNQAHCNDYHGMAFGGWAHPTVKQYGDDGGECGIGYDINVDC